VNRLTFRARLFAFLALFALVPSLVLTFAWGGTMTRVLPPMSGKAAWDTVAATGAEVIGIARRAPSDAAGSAAIAEHERSLANATTRSRQFELIAERAPSALVAASLILLGLLAFLAARLAGHLSRQMTRPLDEVVSWTGRIARGERLPDGAARGAPEFDVLRAGMRQMSADIESGRKAALEAERLAALRESARQVAHELKNPLTPIRFAVAQLRNKVPPELADTVGVIDAESARLEAMARSFAQFGRLPDGPEAEVDVAELVAAAVRSSIPAGMRCDVLVTPGLALMGRHDALTRALANVLLNAVEASGMSGHIAVEARAIADAGDGSVEISVHDDGPGIDPAKLPSIWDPYVTGKPGGTGLGLAIVRQTVVAHGGTVSAESAGGSGTTVRLRLPVRTTRPPEIA
jgi:signal transduction histidine kinase